MMVKPTTDRDSTWRDINLFCRSYIQLQKARVGFSNRIFQLENREAVNAGIMVQVIEKKLDEASGKERRSIRYKLIDDTDETKQALADLKLKLKETNQIYALLLSHKVRLHAQETDMLKQAKEVMSQLALIRFCERVRGMGDVAALTLMGYIQPIRVINSETGETKIVRFPELLRYAGLAPGSALRAGEQGNFNPQFKGRLLGVIAKNIIMAADPYYSQIYRIKKDFYTNRPDIIALRGDSDIKKKRKASKDRMHKMALRAMTKLVLSHSHEIIVTEYLGRPISEVDSTYRGHRNSVPIKPEDPFEGTRVLERFTRNLAKFTEELNKRWIEDTTPDKKEYFDYLNHAELGE